MIKIFVSHAWADKVRDQFGQVYQELEQFDLWIDKTELSAGRNIRQQIKTAISDAEIVLVLWSANAAKSPDVQFEIQTAVELEKIILPCIIDDYPISNSKHLDGMLYIDLRETEAMTYPALGWMKVRYFLTDYYINKMAKRIENYEPARREEAMQLLEDLKAGQLQQKTRISLIEDSFYRIKSNASGRNKNNSYIKNMLSTAINQFDDNTSFEKKQVAEFLKYAKLLFTQYPDDDDVSVKEREHKMLEKILQMDPKEKNESLMFFKRGIVTNL